MKNLTTNVVCLLLAMLISAAALTQSPETSAPSVATARCAYTPSDTACPNTDKRPGDLAQVRGRFPRRPVPRRYPQPSFGPMPRPSGRHLAIGAAIGFTLGSIARSDGTVRTHLATGLIGGLFGALIGGAIPSYQARFAPLPVPNSEKQDEIAVNFGSQGTPDSSPASHKPPVLDPVTTGNQTPRGPSKQVLYSVYSVE